MTLRLLPVVLALAFAPGYTRADETSPARRFGDVTQARVLAERDSGRNWLVNGGRFTGEHYSPLARIDASNVARLGLAWVADIPTFLLAAEPIVVDGVVYLSGSLSRVFAFDAATGEALWKFDPEVSLGFSHGNSQSARINRGVAVWNGLVYVGTGDCRLVAIDARDGKKRWEASVCDPAEAAGAGITGAPRVADDVIFMGYLGANWDVRGSLVAFDAETGRELWRFWTVPGNPAHGVESEALDMASRTWERDGWSKAGGAVVWEAIRYDPVTGLVFFGTASAQPINTSLRGPGDHLFANCVIAVDAKTGTYRWHYQTVPRDAWDYDATMPKIVTDLTLEGVERRVLFEAGKSGFFYVLDARSGELLAADPIAKVTWASHIDLKTGRPVEVPGARYYENENPEQPVRVSPAAIGARNWQAMSYSPKTGLVYMPVTDMPGAFSAGGYYGAHIEGLGYGPDEEVPIGAGRLIAWDPVERKTRWRVDHPIPFNGGVLSTASDLVFQGTGTGEFRAYDGATGTHLWSQKTGTTIQAAPVTYEVAGEQYVLVAAGKGGGIGMVIGIRAASQDALGPPRLLAYKLGGRAKPPPTVQRPPMPRPPARAGSAEQVERGAVVWEELGCELCHGAHAIGVFERRFGDGAVPDLRYAPAEVHEQWHAIVLGGNRRLQGMPGFSDSIGVEDSEAVRAWVIEQAWKAYAGSGSSGAH